MQKRGQITVFIIIGIIMLFLSAGIFYLTKSTVKETITADGTPVVEKVPLTFSPLQTFTENCLKSVGKRGLVILGQQGGYISPEILGTYSITKPTDSIGIDLQPTKIPYWHYNSPQNTEKKIAFASLQPKLYYKDDPKMSIEAQLNRYVAENLDNCLENYSVFLSQGFNVSQGNKQVKTTVGTSSVNFQLTMTLDTKKGSSTNKMSNFYTALPLKFKHYYEVADKITQIEKNYTFLEKQGLNLISAFSGIDAKKLPPTIATSFELFPLVSWNEKQVGKNIQRLFSSYIPMLRFLGSDNFYDYIYPDSKISNFYQAVYDQMVVPIKGTAGTNVNFNYFNWPLYLKTNSVNGVIKPFHFFVKYSMLMMGQQTYETNYDVSYPVLVTLRDTSAFNGEGYDFVFALESNIRNNKAAVGGSTEVKIIPKASRLACNKEHWDTGLLKTVVVDSFTKQPLETVKIGFTIPEQDECEIGLTNKKGELQSNYPAVYGGVMNFLKKDYLINYYPIDTYQYHENKSALIGYPVKGLSQDLPSKVVELHKFKMINISVQKKNLGKCVTTLNCKSDVYGVAKIISCDKMPEQCFFNQGSNLFLDKKKSLIASLEANGSLSRYHDYYFTNSLKTLSDKESATVLLRRVGDLNSAVTSGEFSASINLKGTQKKEVSLVPGIYEVSGTIALNDVLNISAEQRCITYDILTWTEENCYTINGSEMKSQITGMITWDTPKTYLKITPEDLYGSNDLTFYLLSQDLGSVPEKIKGKARDCIFSDCDTEDIWVNGRVMEDLQMMGQMGETSKKLGVREALEPRFS